MKRPLAIIGLTGLTAQCVALWTEPAVSLLFSVFLLVGGLCAVLLRKIPARVTICTVLFAAGTAMALTSGAELLWVEPVRAIAGQNACVTGTLLECDADESGCTITVQADTVKSENGGAVLCHNVRLTLYSAQALDAEKYDTVTLRGVRLYAPQDGFGLSARSTFAARGVYLLGSFSVYDATVFPCTERPWLAGIDAVRARLTFVLRTMLPEPQSALIMAMLLGDRSALSRTVTADFRSCGMSAMLVVSGMHLSLLIGALLFLLKRMVRSVRLAAVLCMPAVLFMLALTGFTGSAVRAGIMQLIFLLAIAVMRSADPLNSLGVAALVLLLVRPFVGGDVGVQLSFLATAGILTGAAPIRNGIQARLPHKMQQMHGLRRVLDAFSVSLAASLFTAPLVVLAFGQMSLIGPIANTLFAVPAQVLLLSGAAAGIFGALGVWCVARPAALIAGTTANLFDIGTKLFARLPVIYDRGGLLTLWIAGVLAAAGLILLTGARRRRVLLAVGVCAVLLVIPAGLGAAEPIHTTIGLIRCGDGLAVEVAQGGHSVTLLQNVPISAADTVSSYFRGRPATDMLILPAQSNCSGDASTAACLVRMNKVGALMLASDFLPDELRLAVPDCPIRTGASAGITFDTDFTVERLDTESGCWYYMTVSGCRVLIPIGDADAHQLPMNRRRVELLVISEMPAAVELLHMDAIAVSCSAYSELAQIQALAGSACRTIYTTAQCGTFTLTYAAKGKFTAARE